MRAALAPFRRYNSCEPHHRDIFPSTPRRTEAMKNPHQEPFTRLSPTEAAEIVRGGAAFIDVREPDEYAVAHAIGARLVPLNTIFTDPALIPSDSDIVFICRSGRRSAMAAEMAAATGRAQGALYNVEGGTDAWLEIGLPRE
jgi:rhodanese-related sulfurtransferase